jgi:voltage-gated potassium channel
MQNTTEFSPENKIGLLNMLVLVLSVYVLGALLIDTFFKLPPETSKLLNYIDNLVCVFFFIEFTIRLKKSENKLQFMKWGWIDLLSSIPMLDCFRVGRSMRLLRLLRVLKAFRSTKNLVNHIFANKVNGAFASISTIAILLVIFSALAILQVETDPNSNIKTAEDAIWWSYVTVTTVGYGDKFPITTEGRIIASVLMTAGVGLFGTFTAFVSSWFLAEKKEEESETK